MNKFDQAVGRWNRWLSVVERWFAFCTALSSLYFAVQFCLMEKQAFQLRQDILARTGIDLSKMPRAGTEHFPAMFLFCGVAALAVFVFSFRSHRQQYPGS